MRKGSEITYAGAPQMGAVGNDRISWLIHNDVIVRAWQAGGNFG